MFNGVLERQAPGGSFVFLIAKGNVSRPFGGGCSRASLTAATASARHLVGSPASARCQPGADATIISSGKRRDFRSAMRPRVADRGKCMMWSRLAAGSATPATPKPGNNQSITDHFSLAIRDAGAVLGVLLVVG